MKSSRILKLSTLLMVGTVLTVACQPREDGKKTRLNSGMRRRVDLPKKPQAAKEADQTGAPQTALSKALDDNYVGRVQRTERAEIALSTGTCVIEKKSEGATTATATEKTVMQNNAEAQIILVCGAIPVKSNTIGEEI